MNGRRVVLVDMDGVLADFDGATVAYLTKNHPTIPLVNDRQHFYYRDSYKDVEHQTLISDLHVSRNFFRDLPLIEGALQGWQRLHELGYYPRICSSPLRANRWCKEEKLEWIAEHLGVAVAREAIIDSAKEAHDGIALIDDRPIIRNADQASWQHIVFDQSYNWSVATDFRLRGWYDARLGQLLEVAERHYKDQAAGSVAS